MIYELPRDMKMSRKENKEITKKEKTIAIRIKGLAKSFLTGLLFFITIPIFIYKKIEKQQDDLK